MRKTSTAFLFLLAVFAFSGCAGMTSGKNPWAAPPKKKTLAERWEETAKKSAEARANADAAKKSGEAENVAGKSVPATAVADGSGVPAAENSPAPAPEISAVPAPAAAENVPEKVAEKSETVPAEISADDEIPPVPAPAREPEKSGNAAPEKEIPAPEKISAELPAKATPVPAGKKSAGKSVPAKSAEPVAPKKSAEKSVPAKNVPAAKPAAPKKSVPAAPPPAVKVAESKEFAEVTWADSSERIVVANRTEKLSVKRGEIFVVFGKNMELRGTVRLSVIDPDGRTLGFTLVSGNAFVGDMVARPSEKLRAEMKEKLPARR